MATSKSIGLRKEPYTGLCGFIQVVALLGQWLQTSSPQTGNKLIYIYIYKYDANFGQTHPPH